MRKSIVKSTWRKRHDSDDDPLTYPEWLSIATYHPDQNLAWREHEQYGRQHEQLRKRYEETFDMGGEA